jgi:hypothetical protein
MHLISLLAQFRRPLALFALTLGLTAPVVHALTADELLPANLVGKTLTFTHTAVTANTLDGFNSYTVKFTSTTNYVRSGAGITTEGGIYNILSTLLTGTDIRTTTIMFTNNWASPGSTVAVAMSLTNANNVGSFAVAELLNGSKSSAGIFTIGGSTTGGATVPAISSASTASATVGQNFSYQIASSNSPTSYSLTSSTSGLSVNATTGLVTGSFATAGAYTFTVSASNASGTGSQQVTVTVAGATTAASYAGTYTGSIFVSNNGAAETVFTAFSGTVSAAGVLSAQGGEVTGTVNANGVVTFNSNGLGMTTGTIANQQLNALGSANVLGSTTRIFRIFATGGTTVATAVTAPSNLVGYRNKTGQSFQFALTGSTRGAVWGTDIYSDDSDVATAAVHAGVLRAGESGTVTVTLLGGQKSFTASTRNGVSSGSWTTWPGSYSFAGAGTINGTSVATTVPTLAVGYVATTTSLAVGGRFVFSITVTGGGSYSYQWYLNGVAISGATANPYVIASATSAAAGTYTVDVTNSFGTSRLTAGTLTVGASGSPVLALQPISKTVAPGATFTLATSASGSGLSYQWYLNNVALSGETGAILLRQNAGANDAGNYTVRVTNSAGSVTSSAGTITISASASRPANISVRTNVATGTFVIPGFVIQGTGSKRVLIRAVGPGLGAFGLTGTMADPKFAVFQGSTKIAENDDWTAANIGTAFTATGAFTLTASSKDAALVTDLAAGKDYTVQVTNATGSGGIVLIEVYDADVLTGTSTSKLVNVSVLGQTAPGADLLTLGLVIQGSGPRTLLVRGIGPKLSAFNVSGAIADPRLQIYDSQQRAILANDDWGNADFVNELTQASNYVGAFALDAGSKDSATLALLDPGAYTVQVANATSATGLALVEIYEVP